MFGRNSPVAKQFSYCQTKPLLCFWCELSENERLICAGKSVGMVVQHVPCDELQGVSVRDTLPVMGRR